MRLKTLLLGTTSAFFVVAPFQGSAGSRAVLLLASALVVSALLARGERIGYAAVPRTVLAALVAWTFVAIASVAWSLQPAYTLGELKAEIAYGWLALAVFFCAAYWNERLWTWVYALLAGSVLVFVANQLYDVLPASLSRHAVSGQSGMWSTYLVLIAPFVLALGWHSSWHGTRAALVRGAALLLLFIAAWQTGNRMVWVALGTQLLVALVCSQWFLAKQGGRPPGLRAPIALALAVVLPVFIFSVMERIAIATPEASVAAGLARDVRPRIWMAAWTQFVDAPWIGHGFGREILASAFILVTPDIAGHPLVMHSHNLFIDMALQLGIVGLAAFLAVLAALALQYRAFMGDARVAHFGVLGLTLLAGFVVKNLTDDFLHRHDAVVFWALNAMLIGLARGRLLDARQTRGVATPVPAAPDPLLEMLPDYSIAAYVGAGGDAQQFRQIGQEMLVWFGEYGQLKPDDRVLEIGCGIGRIAIPLTQYLERGSYDGFDIVASGIEWCQAKVTPRYPNFRFFRADIRNRFYHPEGRTRASEYTFPFENATFDFVVLTSVFTHMLTADVERYMSEIARVLKPGGRCFMTAYVISGEARGHIAAGSSLRRFLESPEGYWTESPDNPEGSVGYASEYLESLIARNGMERTRFVPGAWWQSAFAQDIVVARRMKANG